MRRLNRETTVFTTSAIDLFASALGAFILLVMILFPYYRNAGSDDAFSRTQEIQEMRRLASGEIAEMLAEQERTGPHEPDGHGFAKGMLEKLLADFQRTRVHMGIVIDEHGGTSGIVTLEDILEEIVGEFTTDPADQIEDVVREGPDSFLVSGTANIRELNRAQGWELPTDGPKTLNGLILELLETIPEPTTCLKVSGYPLEIVASDDNRVRTVRIGPRLDEEES